MKLIVIAGPPSAGKTAVSRQIISHFNPRLKCSYLKIDVVRAFEDEELKKEFNIPARKVYSGDVCPDHVGILVMKDAIDWADSNKSDILIVESAGLCLRCSPYTTQSLGISVLSAVSGTNSPLKMSAMLALSDIAVVTRVDLVSQAEKEVFREKIKEVRGDLDIVETNAVFGTGMRYLLRAIEEQPDIKDPSSVTLRGNPPLGVCTVCAGKKQIGWENHFGVIRKLSSCDFFFRGD
ncbi:Ni2+-binding GTPase involved in maturation of urease and hydrogenase [Methanomicrobium sp. W14]|uniref:GTP-binding protein n=1 Tax=Methanomicrobium sp. W14 TaxID=2817839 RepID=UPI001AE2FBDF|nr:GTP-binding protein [Methanomicrobium sp. W14]MBP2133542.1 Ni2+-binding GTPase involved in maturation of urease and hydrogenase [Methanomicrobium sp. W14]